MTGCMLINSYYRLILELSGYGYTPVQKLRKAFEMRFQKPFNDVLQKPYAYDYTILRGLILSILREHYSFSLAALRDLTHWRNHQPIYRAIRSFQSQLNIDPNLRRDYEAILKMLSII